MKKTILPNVFTSRGKLCVLNSTPGQTFFDEGIFKDGNTEYRILDPTHSKLAAAFMNRCKTFGIKEDSFILYLGASHGYTPSFVSDMVPKGGVYCIEFSPIVCRDLVFVCEERENMVPILADAKKPEEYKDIPPVDIVYQDIAQKKQVDIFLDNFEKFGKPGAYGLLALKAKSVDAMKHSKVVGKQVRQHLDRTNWLSVVDAKDLYPHEKDHTFFIVKKKV